jgi:hypothetical protein
VLPARQQQQQQQFIKACLQWGQGAHQTQCLLDVVVCCLPLMLLHALMLRLVMLGVVKALVQGRCSHVKVLLG